MFARIKKSGKYQYLQIVQNRREGVKTIQRVISTIGRMDQLQPKGEIEKITRSLSRFSDKVLLVLSDKSQVSYFEQKDRSSPYFREAVARIGHQKSYQTSFIG